MSENAMTKSQAKRKARLEESKKAKRQSRRNQFAGNFVIIALLAIFIGAIGSFVYFKATTTQASSDYGAYLNDDGTLKGINPTDYIEPLDYKNIFVTSADVAYTEEEMNTDIESILSQHKVANTDPTLAAADGDTLNIDYVGTVDGVEFEGGNTNGAGADLTLGSGSYVDDFEEQLIGSHPGDSVTVEVTFPEDYSSEDLQGKDAVFQVTVNSIQVLPEFTDDFVAANLSDIATTVEDYKDYLKTTNELSNLQTYLTDYIKGNAVANSVDEGYLKYLKGIGKYEQESYYNSYNETMMAYMGAPAYNSFSEFTGMSNSEFETYLEEECRTRAAIDMTYQYIFQDAGLTIEDGDYETKAEQLGTTAFDTYGRKYIMQMTLQDKVVSYLMENTTIQ